MKSHSLVVMKTRLNDLFDQMEPEEGNELDSRIKVEENRELEKIKENFIEFSKQKGNIAINLANFEMVYDGAKAKNITQFVYTFPEILPEFTEESLGSYVNTLIKKSPDTDHYVLLNDKMNSISNIGFRNENKNIKIIGEAIKSIGERMKGGRIEIQANRIHEIGYWLRGGEIVINGTAKRVGVAMRGGKIIVNGNTGNVAEPYKKKGTTIIKGTLNQMMGFDMKGGEILVEHLDKSRSFLKNHYETLPNGYTRITPK